MVHNSTGGSPFMSIPKYKLTLGATEFINDAMISAKVTRVENGFDSALIVLDDTSYYPATVTDGTTVQLDVKDYSDASYTTILKGIVRFPTANISKEGRTLPLTCLGSGRGLGKMLVGYEFGSQSINPSVDTVTEIVSDATHGIIPKYVNHILGSAIDSGFNYTVSTSVANSIPYVNFPYKPALGCLQDLVDLVTAQQVGAAGIHFIVTTDDILHMKFISATQVGWAQYYGGSQANATLDYGSDYFSISLEKMAPESNYVLYYGNWKRPSNGDAWTGADCDDIWTLKYDGVLSVDTTNHIVNDSSLKCLNDVVGGSLHGCYIPVGYQAGWDFSGFTDFNVPTMNFYFRKHGVITGIEVRIFNYDAGGAVTGYGVTDITADITADDKWYHFSLPLGPYYNTPERYANFKWYGSPAIDWADLDCIMFHMTHTAENAYFNIDGFYIGDANICRVAWNSDLPGGEAEMRLITDDIGKDDSLKAADDSGLMAQLAYSELLRLQKPAYVGTVETPMIKDALPGQLFNIQTVDYRVTKLVHTLSPDGCKTMFSITDDVTNGRARARYEDINKQYANIRPEFQDRQASSIKAGSVDWRIARLVKDYA